VICEVLTFNAPKCVWPPSPPGPAGGAYRPPSWILGVGAGKGREGNGGGKVREEEKGEGRKGRETGKEGGGMVPPAIKNLVKGLFPSLHQQLTRLALLLTVTKVIFNLHHNCSVSVAHHKTNYSSAV